MDYEFQLPSKEAFTIYSKNKCDNCVKVKLLLKDNNILYDEINSDKYLMQHREKFLDFMKAIIGKEWKTFPLVFNDKGEFIGGFKETQKYIDKMLCFHDNF
jgi:glutaredoxin